MPHPGTGRQGRAVGASFSAMPGPPGLAGPPSPSAGLGFPQPGWDGAEKELSPRLGWTPSPNPAVGRDLPHQEVFQGRLCIPPSISFWGSGLEHSLEARKNKVSGEKPG